MIIETATIWTFCALALMMFICFVYFLIFFSIWYVVLFGLSKIVGPLIRILKK